MPIAQFKFHDSLNDFLADRNKNSWMDYSFNLTPSVKDAVEAIGIPHVEIKEIIVDGQLVSFNHRLLGNERIEVFPFIQSHLHSTKFILDVHLGKLARLLRLTGFDTLYQKNYSDKDIAAIAKDQGRIVLTRDIGLLKHKSIHWGYWVRSQQPMEQLKEVIQRFALNDRLKPFTKCLDCNGPIEPVAKEKIMDQLLPNTITHFSEFCQCRECKKIYWKGSHYDRMIRLLKASFK